MSKVSEDKRFSAASAATLGQLEGLDERFGAMTSAADAIEALLDAGSVPAARLVEAKHELAQLNGDLEKFQFTQVDAIETGELNSGKADAKAHRKRLNAEVEAAQARIKALHARVTEAEAAAGAGEGGAGARASDVAEAPAPASAPEAAAAPPVDPAEVSPLGCTSTEEVATAGEGAPPPKRCCTIS